MTEDEVLKTVGERLKAKGMDVYCDTAKEAVREAIPLVQKDMLERLMEPSEAVLIAGQAKQAEIYGEGWKPNKVYEAVWQAMLRQFASETGIEIE